MKEEEAQRIRLLTILCLITALCGATIYMAVTRQVAVDEAYNDCNEYYQAQLPNHGFHAPPNASPDLTAWTINCKPFTGCTDNWNTGGTP